MRRALLLLPLVLPLAACGGGKSSSGTTATTVVATGPLAIAAQKTQAAGSEQMTVTANIELTASEAFSLSGKGAYDNNAQSGDLNGTIGIKKGGSTTLDEIFGGNTIWLKSPLFAAAMPADKSWLKIDLDKGGQGLGFDFKALTGENPGDVLTDLERTSSKVTTVGKEKIGGVETTHYRAAIDPSKVPQGDKVQQVTGVEYKPIDVWVDAQGLVRKVQLDYTAKTDPTKPARSHIVLDMEFSNFGTKVTVMPPPDSQSLDASNSGSITG